MRSWWRGRTADTVPLPVVAETDGREVRPAVRPGVRPGVGPAVGRGVRHEAQPPAVRIRGLVKRFGGFAAVDGVDLDVARGEVFGFLGPNGSGKTTLIRMLTGSIAATRGSIEVLGENVVHHPERIASRIGYMSQKFSLFGDLTVEENLRFYAGVYDVPPERYKERRDYVLRMADLVGHEQARPDELSVGLKQRLALGAATMHEPELLFLDEPTSGVDPVARRAFWDLIHDLAQRGVTLFVTTHYMEEASNCTRLAFMYRGRIIADGTPRELRTRTLSRPVVEVRLERQGHGPQGPEPHEGHDGGSDAGRADALITHLESAAGAGVGDVYASGAAVHAVLDGPDAGDGPAWLERRLHAEGFPEAVVVPVTPSLEDVFVTLVAAQRRS